MTLEQKEQFELFKNFVRKWIYEDCQSAKDAGARFLVLMGIFNYIEIIGAFVIGKGSRPPARFKAFLPYLGQSYGDLLNLPGINLYSELRCGFTHRFVPKSRKFHLYKEFVPPFSLVMGGKTSSMSGYILQNSKKQSCGIVFENNEWHIILSKLLEDYNSGVEKLIKEIETGSCGQNRINIFFDTFKKFNFKNLTM